MNVARIKNRWIRRSLILAFLLWIPFGYLYFLFRVVMKGYEPKEEVPNFRTTLKEAWSGEWSER